MPDPLGRFPDFVQSVKRRLDAGRGTYGDRSFERSPGALLEELQCEALDLAGWGYVLWERIERLRQELERSNGLGSRGASANPEGY